MAAYTMRFTLLLLALISATALFVPQQTSAVDVTFVVYYKLTYGHGFVIAGNATVLGDWVPSDAPLMGLASNSETYWTLTSSFDEGTYVEFKPVKVVYDTKDPLEWYSGSNLNIAVQSNCTNVYIEWNGSALSSSVA